MVSTAVSRPAELNIRLILRSILRTISLGYGALLLALIVLRLLRVTSPFALTLLLSITPLLFVFLPIALAMAILSRSRAAVVTSLMLGAIAAFWLGGIYFTGAVATAAEEPIRVLVFNASGKDLARAYAEPWFNTRPADIILMQETFYTRQGSGLSNVRETYPYQAVQPRTEAVNYRGVATLSVYPIEEEGREGLGSESAFSRVVIDLDGVRVAVYNVSLPAPFESDEAFSVSTLLRTYNTDVRDRALDLLIARLEQEDLPAIVGGEFNLTEFDPAYDRLAGMLTDTFREAGSGPGFTFPVAGGYSLDGLLRPILRLDYLWCDDTFRARSAVVGEPIPGSDRLPLLVELDRAGES
ncbi:MAG: hypothetical protein IPK19_19920 [Chloroflexi bacterium]|nr:hypothetical protein [Chloroflexota bacterium]